MTIISCMFLKECEVWQCLNLFTSETRINGNLVKGNCPQISLYLNLEYFIKIKYSINFRSHRLGVFFREHIPPNTVV